MEDSMMNQTDQSNNSTYSTDGSHIPLYFRCVACCIGVLVNVVEISIFNSSELRSRGSLILAGISSSNLVVILGSLYYSVWSIACEGRVSACPASATNDALKYLELGIVGVQGFAYGASIYLLSILAYERYSAVCRTMKPMYPGRVCQATTYCLLVSVATGFACLRVAVLVVEDAYYRTLSDVILVYWTVFISTLPAIFLVFTSARLFWNIRHRERSMALLREGTKRELRAASQAQNAGANRVVIFVCVVYLITNTAPRSILNFSMWTQLPSDLVICLISVEILGFSSPDCIGYYLYNAAYRRKFNSMLCFCRSSPNPKDTEPVAV